MRVLFGGLFGVFGWCAGECGAADLLIQTFRILLVLDVCVYQGLGVPDERAMNTCLDMSTFCIGLRSWEATNICICVCCGATNICLVCPSSLKSTSMLSDTALP